MKKILAIAIIPLGLMIAMDAMAAKPTKAAKPREARQDSTASIKIGIVNMQKILLDSKKARTLREGFMKELEVKKAQLADKAKGVQEQEEALARLDPNTPMETRRQKTDKIKQDARELNHLRQDVEEELKRKDQALTQRLIGEIMQVIKNQARNERFGVILERTAVITAEESIDITDKIIKAYDAQKK